MYIHLSYENYRVPVLLNRPEEISCLLRGITRIRSCWKPRRYRYPEVAMPLFPESTGSTFSDPGPAWDDWLRITPLAYTISGTGPGYF